MIAVAIDGPAGAGKSTIAKTAAKRLGFIYVDTGALYRSIGYYVIKQGKSLEIKEDIVSCLSSINVEIEFVYNEQHVILNGEDVNASIRTPEVSIAASKVSAVPEVREFLLGLQRDFAKKYNCIMDGRDIGTVVLPNAEVKIFLTASCEERANRRYKELIEKGEQVNYEDVLTDIQKRDYNDSHREIAPMKPAEDSVLVDSTGQSIEQNVQAVIDVIKAKVPEIK